MQLFQQLPAAWPGKAINTYHFLPIWRQRIFLKVQKSLQITAITTSRLHLKRGNARANNFLLGAAPLAASNRHFSFDLHTTTQSAASARPRVWRFSFFPSSCSRTLLNTSSGGLSAFSLLFHPRTWLANSSSTTRAALVLLFCVQMRESAVGGGVCVAPDQTGGQTGTQNIKRESHNSLTSGTPCQLQQPAGSLASYSRQY